MAIEAALVTLLKSYAAVTAIVGHGDDAHIRPYKLWQKDNLLESDALLIRVNSENPENDLSHHGGLVVADVSVISCSLTLANARRLAEACRTNMTANPGEGLEAYDGLSASVQIESIASGTRSPDFVPFSDDSDEGFYIVDAHYSVLYQETV